METTQKFGGPWTEEKLNLFTKYLDAYLTALQNKHFKKIYIDAFAGTGEIETSDGDQHLVGSAKRALSVAKQFDQYYFIEIDEKKADDLQKMVDTEFPRLKCRVRVLCNDANIVLEKLTHDIDWRYNRGLLFLDPYATQVNWTTLETVANTKSIDVWYLFPFHALERMLPKNGKYEKWEDCLDRLLGDTGWREEFYKKDPQMAFSEMFPDVFCQMDGERKVKDANTDHIKEYILARLDKTFPCVSRHARIFMNSRNSPMFLFCFAVSNENESAQKLALRIADHILKYN